MSQLWSDRVIGVKRYIIRDGEYWYIHPTSVFLLLPHFLQYRVHSLRFLLLLLLVSVAIGDGSSVVQPHQHGNLSFGEGWFCTSRHATWGGFGSRDRVCHSLLVGVRRRWRLLRLPGATTAAAIQSKTTTTTTGGIVEWCGWRELTEGKWWMQHSSQVRCNSVVWRRRWSDIASNELW